MMERAAHRSSSWEYKLRQRLWNGAGGVYDAFLIDVHLKKREERFNSITRCQPQPTLCRPLSQSQLQLASAATRTPVTTATATGTASPTAGHKRRSQRFWAKLPLCVQIWNVEMLGINMKIALNNCWAKLETRIACMQSLANILNDAARQEISEAAAAGGKQARGSYLAGNWGLYDLAACWACSCLDTPRFASRPRWFMQVGNYIAPTLVANGLLTLWFLAPNECTPNCCTSIDSRSLGSRWHVNLFINSSNCTVPRKPLHHGRSVPYPTRFICDAESHSPLNRW